MIRSIATLVSLLALAACSPQVVDSYCLNARPITYSASDDTPDTKRQIKEHNAVYVRLCQ